MIKDEIIFPRKKEDGLTNKEYQVKLKIFGIELQVLERKMLKMDIIPEDKKTSTRGWCYLLENFGTITKDELDKAGDMIGRCVEKGYIPIDFVAMDKAREWYNVEPLVKEYMEPKEYVCDWLDYIKGIAERKDDIAFWESQKYYIQFRTEKLDIRNLFSELCKKYHIPISNSVGWSDRRSRDEMAKRYKQAEEIGLIPVELYYQDYDPMGIKIANSQKSILKKIEKATGWNPDNLIVDVFGLSKEFIGHNDLLWIDNLITGTGRNLGEIYERYKAGTLRVNAKGKKERFTDDEIKYIEENGVRKCEANAVLTVREAAIADCEKTILKYLGEGDRDPFKIYNEKLEENREKTREILKAVNFEERILELINDIEKV